MAHVPHAAAELASEACRRFLWILTKEGHFSCAPLVRIRMMVATHLWPGKAVPRS